MIYDWMDLGTFLKDGKSGDSLWLCAQDKPIPGAIIAEFLEKCLVVYYQQQGYLKSGVQQVNNRYPDQTESVALSIGMTVFTAVTYPLDEAALAQIDLTLATRGMS